MSDDVKPVDLAAIRARAGAATHGNLRVTHYEIRSPLRGRIGSGYKINGEPLEEYCANDARLMLAMEDEIARLRSRVAELENASWEAMGEDL